jgi:hypothetical protein
MASRDFSLFVPILTQLRQWRLNSRITEHDFQDAFKQWQKRQEPSMLMVASRSEVGFTAGQHQSWKLWMHFIYESLNNAVGAASRYMVVDTGIGLLVLVGSRIFKSPYHLDWLLGPNYPTTQWLTGGGGLSGNKPARALS